MESIEKVRQAVLEKVRREAEVVIREAEEKAKRIIEEAKKRKQKEIEEARQRLRDEIGYEEKLVAAKIEARRILCEAKQKVFNELRRRAMEILEGLSEIKRIESIKRIVSEILASGVIQSDKIVLYISPRDVDAAWRAVEELGLSSRVAAIEKANCIGGVIIEDPSGSVRIDACYETRLDAVLRARAPEISRKLFGETR